MHCLRWWTLITSRSGRCCTPMCRWRISPTSGAWPPPSSAVAMLLCNQPLPASGSPLNTSSSRSAVFHKNVPRRSIALCFPQPCPTWESSLTGVHCCPTDKAAKPGRSLMHGQWWLCNHSSRQLMSTTHASQALLELSPSHHCATSSSDVAVGRSSAFE